MSQDEAKLRELEELRARVRALESELGLLAGASAVAAEPPGAWAPKGFYTGYYATTGFILGMFAAAISLLVNVVGAPVVNKGPLDLIRVYLTFPLGEKALQLATTGSEQYAIGDGVILTLGCCLYLGTGMLLGVPFFVALVWLTQGRSTIYRVVVATVLATLLWVVNFWLLLSWLQPLLFGGRWITDPQVLPSWVALLTHLVFGWTLAVLYPWGTFQAYEQPRWEGPGAAH